MILDFTETRNGGRAKGTWRAETNRRRYMIVNPHGDLFHATVVRKDGRGETEDVVRYVGTFQAAARACQAHADRMRARILEAV